MDCTPFTGIICTFIGVMMLSLIGVISKMISYINPIQLALVRSVGLLIGCLPIAVYRKKNVIGDKSHRHLLFIRGFTSATTSILSVAAYAYLPFAVAAITLSTQPILVPVVSRMYLKETIGLIECFSIALTFIGAFLTAYAPELQAKKEHVEFTSTYITGLICAVTSILTRTISVVIQRKLKDVHFSLSIFYVSFIGIIEGVVLTPVVSSYALPLCGLDRILMMMMGILGFLFQMFYILGIQKEKASIVSMSFMCSEIILGMLFQVAIFHRDLDLCTVVGALLVMFSVGAVCIKKWLLTLPTESSKRRKLKFLLL